MTDLSNRNGLTLTFDMLFADETEEDNMPWLRASLQHCDADWNPDLLSPAEYLDGFNETDIGYGEPSIGGITTLYRHFEVTVPPEGLRPKLTGNYLLNIYADSDPDNVILQAPFMVEEGSATVKSSVSDRTDIDFKKAHQQLEIEVTPMNVDSRLRPQDFKVYITRDNNPASRRFVGYPSAVDNKSARYFHKRELIFPAGNEYRRMEISDNNTPMLHVDHIEWHDPFYHQILQLDEPRTGSVYLSQFNNGGKFVVREYNSDNSDIEADYAVVHFFLDGKHLKPDMPIYIEGDFTGKQLTPEFKMTWDPENKMYYKSLLLKQGAYDYKYVTPESFTVANPIEGDYSDTGNIYNIAVYYRVPGERHDRLATTALISTNSQF